MPGRQPCLCNPLGAQWCAVAPALFPADKWPQHAWPRTWSWLTAPQREREAGEPTWGPGDGAGALKAGASIPYQKRDDASVLVPAPAEDSSLCSSQTFPCVLCMGLLLKFWYSREIAKLWLCETPNVSETLFFLSFLSQAYRITRPRLWNVPLLSELWSLRKFGHLKC